MLFASKEFLFFFLPLALLIFHGARHIANGKIAVNILIIFSLIFYSWWEVEFLFLLLLSVSLNYLFLRLILLNSSKLILAVALLFNLGLLAYFKYRNFLIENIELLFTGSSNSFENLGTILIPLGISFYTFQQIAMLIDAKDGTIKTSPPFLHFVQFITFFPQLIAGPIVLFKEVRDQIEGLQKNQFDGLAVFGPGVAVFSFGLFKKVCLADTIAPFADLAFDSHQIISTLEAWAGSVAYSLQLYFDFSGYSDMAVGLGLMFGMRLPFNFDTPFRARNMTNFWKSWHITMTRFFMLYVYSPIALRLGRFAQFSLKNVFLIFFITVLTPTIFTFVLSGLWHGAGWTFIMFGCVNGLALVLNNGWRILKMPKLPFLISWFLTMLSVIISFVYFRSESIEAAHNFITAMFSIDHFFFPNWLELFAEEIGAPWKSLPVLSSGSYSVKFFIILVILSVLSLTMPNLSKSYEQLKPSWTLASAIAFMLIMSVGFLDRPKVFLYFQF